MSAIALVRHGRTPWNAARRIQGSTDIRLDDVGRSQALAAAAALAGAEDWTAVVSSPMARARETAEIIATSLGLPLLDPVGALVERDCGVAEALTVDEAHARWPDLDYPGAEPTEAAGLRTALAIARIEAATPRAIVVGHGQALRHGVAALTGFPAERIANAEVIVLERTGEPGVPTGWRRSVVARA